MALSSNATFEEYNNGWEKHHLIIIFFMWLWLAASTIVEHVKKHVCTDMSFFDKTKINWHNLKNVSLVGLPQEKVGHTIHPKCME